MIRHICSKAVWKKSLAIGKNLENRIGPILGLGRIASKYKIQINQKIKQVGLDWNSINPNLTQKIE